MRLGYAVGLVRHLLENSGRADITSVKTFAEVGAVGHHWPPHGLRVEFADGTAIFVAFVRTSSLGGGDSAERPWGDNRELASEDFQQ